MGTGVYTSKLPLYAQLYSSPERWRGKYVQTVLMVRQDPRALEFSDAEGPPTAAMVGRDDLHRLYGGLVNRDEMQSIVRDESSPIIIQALLVKIHDVDPTASGGEYQQICSLLQSI